MCLGLYYNAFLHPCKGREDGIIRNWTFGDDGHGYGHPPVEDSFFRLLGVWLASDERNDGVGYLSFHVYAESGAFSLVTQSIPRSHTATLFPLVRTDDVGCKPIALAMYRSRLFEVFSYTTYARPASKPIIF